jgi:hypothetical protein
MEAGNIPRNSVQYPAIPSYSVPYHATPLKKKRKNLLFNNFLINSIKQTLMRKLITLSFLLFSLPILAQQTNTSEVTELSAQIKLLERKLESQERMQRLSDQKLLLVADHAAKENASLKTELKANLELQAQNERAVNLALDEFAKKFETQNKTMEGVQTTLDKQWSQQLILFGILFLVFITAVVIAVKISTKKALEKSRLSWEEFNAYVMRRTGDG